MLRATVLERGRLVRGDTDDPSQLDDGGPSYRILPARLYDRLAGADVVWEEREGEGRVIEWRRKHGIVGQWVGVIQVPGLQLEILPKTNDGDDARIDDVRSNLMTMLIAGGLVAMRARGVADLAVQRGSIHDRLIDAFIDRALFELKRGLDRSYFSEEGNILSLRGKLMIAEQVTKNAAQKHRFFCRHDVFDTATQISTRLKQAARLLLERPLLRSISIKARDMLALLDEVPDVPWRRGDPDPVFHRQNERFASIYRFACMLLEGAAASPKRGNTETFSLLFNMEQIFERFIAAIVKSSVAPQIGATPHSQGEGERRYLFRDRSTGKEVLRLKPDLLIEHGDKRLVVDTKWKAFPKGKPARPTNDDLYQLYAYLRAHDCQRVYLLYPQVEGVKPRTLEALDHGDKVRGEVGVRFVDLNRKLWTREGKALLTQDLESIIREGLGLPAQRQRAEPAGEVTA